MKTKLVLLGAICSFFMSCSSDDNGDGAVKNYFPSNNQNFWKYDVVGDQISGTDSLYISGDTLINNVTHKKIKNKNQSSGIFGNMLTNNGIRKSGDQVLANGKFGFDFNGIALEIPFENFVIFDQDASLNKLLSTVEGNQDLDLGGFPVNMTYKLMSKSGEKLSSFTVRNKTYENVKEIYTILNLKMTGSGFTILDSQDVVVSKHYYVENLGVVYTDTNMAYALNPAFVQLIGSQLPIPATGEFMQEEFLVDYLINP